MASPHEQETYSAPGAGGRSIPAIVVPPRHVRWRRPLAIGGGCFLLLGLVGAAVAAWVFWPASPPELEVISAEVLLLDPPPTLASPPGADPPHAIETLRVRYRTDPEAHVEMSLQPGTHDANGEGVVEVPLRLDEIERTVTRPLRAQVGEGPEVIVTATAERTLALFPTRTGWRCNLGGCSVSDDPTGLAVVAPEGGSVTVGSASGASPDVTEDVLRLADPTALWTSDDATVPLPVRFTFEDGTVLAETLPLGGRAAQRLIEARLRAAGEGPVAVPDEGTGSAMLAFLPSGTALYGAASTVGDIGRVALATTTVARTSCGAYSGPSGTRRLYVERHHAVLTIHDRRTGRRITSRTFQAARVACPRNVTAPPGTDDIVAEVSTVPEEDLRAWLAAR